MHRGDLKGLKVILKSQPEHSVSITKNDCQHDLLYPSTSHIHDAQTTPCASLCVCAFCRVMKIASEFMTNSLYSVLKINQVHKSVNIQHFDNAIRISSAMKRCKSGILPPNLNNN